MTPVPLTSLDRDMVALVAAAFIGSMLATGFILLMSRRIPSMSTLLVAGIMVGYICSAVTDFLITFAEDADIVNLHGWSQGSFSGVSWQNAAVAAAVVALASLAAFMLSSWARPTPAAWA